MTKHCPWKFQPQPSDYIFPWKCVHCHLTCYLLWFSLKYVWILYRGHFSVDYTCCILIIIVQFGIIFKLNLVKVKILEDNAYLNQGSQKLRDNAQRRHRYNHNTLPSHILTTASVWRWRRSGCSLVACAPAARRSLTRQVPKPSPHPRRHCLLDDAITRLRLHQYGDSEISDETQS